jgi:hypothetical protein
MIQTRSYNITIENFEKMPMLIVLGYANSKVVDRKRKLPVEIWQKKYLWTFKHNTYRGNRK